MTIITPAVPENVASAGHRRSIAVVGSGISGSSAAWALSSTADVTLFEAGSRPGGHTSTVEVDYDGVTVPVDVGFIVYNELNYPLLTRLFAHLDVATHQSTMGFSLSLDEGRREWCGETYRSIFAQKRNLVSPSFYRMLKEILRFNRECTIHRDTGVLGHDTIGQYLERRRYSAAFRDDYLIPMAAAIWSTPRVRMLDFPAATFITFFENHRLIHNERPNWRTVTGGSQRYLEKLLAPLGDRVLTDMPVRSVTRTANGVLLEAGDRPAQRFDAVILATHSDQSLALLADPSDTERAILSAVPYRENRVVLHRDPRLLPRRRAAWSAWNYLRKSDATGGEGEVCVTYWMNRLQGIDNRHPLFVTLNPSVEPAPGTVFGEWSFAHPQFDSRALTAQGRLDDIQGVNRTWFAGAWTGHGFHEDGLRSGLAAAEALGGVVPWRPVVKTDEEFALAAE